MVQLVRAGRSPEELSREFEPSAQSISNWVAQADRDEGKRKDGLTSAEREELRQLRKENRQLKLEMAIAQRRPESVIPLLGEYLRKIPACTERRRILGAQALVVPRA